MAHFVRLVLLALLLASGVAQADYPATVKYYLTSSGPRYATDVLACQAMAAGYNDTAHTYDHSTPYPNARCWIASPSNWLDSPRSFVMLTEFYCNGVVQASATCIGNPPPSCASKAGQVADSGLYYTSGAQKLQPISCINQCEVLAETPSPPFLCQTNAGNWLGLWQNCQQATYKYDGNSCSGSDTRPAQATPQPKPCPVCDCVNKGMSWGTVNGVTSCVSAGSPNSNPVKTQSSSSQGTTNTTSGGTTTTSTSTSTTQTQSNGDGTVTSTTTTTSSDGTTKTETKTESFGDFCTKNPTVQMCKAATDSDISGSCDAVVCKGDAIQCAMAKEQARRNCEWFKEQPDWKSKGDQVLAGNDDVPNPADESQRQQVDVTTQLDSSSPIGASCFEDVQITLMGQSATLPISEWCPYLAAIGWIFLSLSYIAAGRIIAGAI